MFQVGVVAHRVFLFVTRLGQRYVGGLQSRSQLSGLHGMCASLLDARSLPRELSKKCMDFPANSVRVLATWETIAQRVPFG